jgi:hypothetical protein
VPSICQQEWRRKAKNSSSHNADIFRISHISVLWLQTFCKSQKVPNNMNCIIRGIYYS